MATTHADEVSVAFGSWLFDLSNAEGFLLTAPASVVFSDGRRSRCCPDVARFREVVPRLEDVCRRRAVHGGKKYPSHCWKAERANGLSALPLPNEGATQSLCPAASSGLRVHPKAIH